jgi:glycosyltransferase involved in cell wall biosynthesis
MSSQFIDTTHLIQPFKDVDALITFIIPTMNRITLFNTIYSLISQTIDKWKAIVIFDGCSPSDQHLLAFLHDKRFLCITIEKLGTENHAGYIRNIGLEVADTPWVGFVDDDDILTTNYIERLQEEIAITPSADAIVFKMVDRGRIVPPLNYNSIVIGEVGISFAYKRSLIQEGFLFEPSSIEDFNLLKKMEMAKKRIVFSPFVTYLVRHHPYMDGPSHRILFN